MSVKEYRSEIYGLEEAINSYNQAADDEERLAGSHRLRRAGMELIEAPRPARATPADIQRAERALDRSAKILMGMG